MRKWLSIISALIIFLIVVIIAAVWQFNRVLKSSHIENLDYHIQTFNVHQIIFSDLSFVYNSAARPQIIRVQGLDANLEWQSLIPHLANINIKQISIVDTPQQSAPSEQTAIQSSSTAFTLPEEWSLPGVFPKQIHIQQLSIKQKCASAICSLTGKVDAVSSSPKQLTINLLVSPGEVVDSQHQLQVNAVYQVEKNLPTLTATLVVDQSINVELSTNLRKEHELYWLGTLKGSATYLDSWWEPYLKTWNININSQTSALENSGQSKLSLQSDWQLAVTPLLNLPATADAVQKKKSITGNLFLNAQIPVPLKIFNLGEFSGQTKIDLEINAGQLNRYAVVADINADHLVIPDAWITAGLQIDTVHLNVQSNVEDNVSLASLPVDFAGVTTGKLQTKFSGHVLLDAFTKKIIVDQLMLNGTAKQLKPVSGYEFENIDVTMHAIGFWQPDSFSFGISEPSQIGTDLTIKPLELNAKSARVMAKQLSVSGKIAQGNIDWPKFHIDSDASISISKLSHPQLKPNAWRWQGKTKGAFEDFDATGELSVSSIMDLQHHLTIKASDLKMDWKMADLFLLAANPFADTIKAWPPLLSFARGKLTANGNVLFDLDKNKLKSSSTHLQLQDIAGVYDTILFEGVTTKANLATSDSSLKITTDEIKVNQVNKGFVIGPMVASGNYEAGFQNLLSGKLTLKKLTGTLMDGSVSTPAQVFDFSRASQNMIVSLKQINLTTLLQQHPGTELSGSGRLSGDIPIEVSSKGVRVIKGVVAAEAPGGQLKYQSARAAELAKTQPSMKLLVEALNDFHYSVLSSGVSYDENGKLLLSVRLEGKNPKLEKGRPINLNVNLEEDLPALLASMQLSSKVTDIVKKRLQDTIQQNSAQQNSSQKNSALEEIPTLKVKP